MACLPVKRPLRCTAHVAVTLGCVQFCRSPKVLENICGSTAAFNIFTFACGKRTPRVCLTCLSSHIQIHLTPIAASPGWDTQQGLVAISRHNGVGRYCRRVLALAGMLIIEAELDTLMALKRRVPQDPPCFHPSGWDGFHHNEVAHASPKYGHPDLRGVRILSRRIHCLGMSIAVYRASI